MKQNSEPHWQLFSNGTDPHWLLIAIHSPRTLHIGCRKGHLLLDSQRTGRRRKISFNWNLGGTVGVWTRQSYHKSQVMRGAAIIDLALTYIPIFIHLWAGANFFECTTISCLSALLLCPVTTDLKIEQMDNAFCSKSLVMPVWNFDMHILESIWNILIWT